MSNILVKGEADNFQTVSYSSQWTLAGLPQTDEEKYKLEEAMEIVWGDLLVCRLDQE